MKINKKNIILIVVASILLIGALVLGIFLSNNQNDNNTNNTDDHTNNTDTNNNPNGDSEYPLYYNVSGTITIDTSRSTEHYKHNAYIFVLDKPIKVNNMNLIEIQFATKYNYYPDAGTKLECKNATIIKADTSSYWVKDYGLDCYNPTILKQPNASTLTERQQIEQIVEEQLFPLWNKNSLNEITNQEKLYLALSAYATQKGKSVYEITSLTKDELEQAYQNITISKLPITHESILSRYLLTQDKDTLMHYDEEKQMYTNANPSGHGACVTYPTHHESYNYNIVNGQYSISYKYIYVHTCEGDIFPAWYGSFEDAKTQQNAILPAGEGNEIVWHDSRLIDNYESIRNQLEDYHYIFEKVNNQFKLIQFDKGE